MPRSKSPPPPIRTPEPQTPIQIKTRLPRELHALIMAEAERSQTPFNREIINRLWEAIDSRPHRSLEQLADYYRITLARLDEMERASRLMLERLERAVAKLEDKS